ncbi:MAG: DUF6017 domain-containing protein, partial [Oscillospiraceae bacterium]
CDMLGCSPPTLRKTIDQLKKNNLMDEQRQGFNKPNYIFLNYYDQQTQLTQGVKEFYTPDSKNFTLPTEKNLPSGLKEICTQECKDFSPNKTNRTQTEFSDTEYQSIYPQGHDETIDEIDDITEIIKQNIGYDICKQSKSEEEYIEDILSIIVDVVCSTSPTVRVRGQDKTQSIVKSQFLKLTHDHIEYVCLCLSDSTSKIKNIRSYLITALYNAPQTMDTYYSQRVKHDLKEC